MKLQVRPAIYNFEVRYEVWEVVVESSLWSGSKIRYEQCYFMRDDSGWQATDYRGWRYAKKDGDGLRSFKTLGEVKQVLDQSFGNNYKIVVWRP